MAARSNALPRRDFLRTLGLAAGITAPEAVGTPEAAAAAPATPSETPAPTTPEPTASSTPESTASSTPEPTASSTPEPTATTPEPTDRTSAPAEAEAPAAQEATAAVVPITVSPADRHLLSRFSYGVSQSLLADTQAGGASAWFEDQLTPDSIPDDFANGLKSWWPHLSWAPQKMWDEDQSDDMAGWSQQDDFLRWTLLRRIYTKRQVEETMAEFWSNLLYIPAPLNKAFPHRVGYDEVIRANALGTFAELLEAAILHPGMLCYLDNAKSTQKAVNENLGRELLELHTVGVDGGYTEDEVTDSALILTGWHVDTFVTWDASYVPADHSIQPVRVMDFEAVNGSSNGQQVAKDYLNYLALHDATAARVCRRLAVRFVSDTPSDALVADLTAVFKDSGTDIKTTLRALVAHPEFKAAANNKVRTPTEDTANTFRALDVEFLPPDGNPNAAAQAILFVAGGIGQQPFEWPRPDGFPDAADAWSSASRALGSWRVHKNAAQTSFPKIGAVYHPPSYWVPTLPIRFDAMVNQLCQRLTGQSANAQMQRAATLATEVEPDEFVLATSTLVKYRIPDLLVALLDSPQHMMR